MNEILKLVFFSKHVIETSRNKQETFSGVIPYLAIFNYFHFFIQLIPSKELVKIGGSE
jgi:hypothetical protein